MEQLAGNGFVIVDGDEDLISSLADAGAREVADLLEMTVPEWEAAFVSWSPTTSACRRSFNRLSAALLKKSGGSAGGSFNREVAAQLEELVARHVIEALARAEKIASGEDADEESSSNKKRQRVVVETSSDDDFDDDDVVVAPRRSGSGAAPAERVVSTGVGAAGARASASATGRGSEPSSSSSAAALMRGSGGASAATHPPSSSSCAALLACGNSAGGGAGAGAGASAAAAGRSSGLRQSELSAWAAPAQASALAASFGAGLGPRYVLGRYVLMCFPAYQVLFASAQEL